MLIPSLWGLFQRPRYGVLAVLFLVLTACNTTPQQAVEITVRWEAMQKGAPLAADWVREFQVSMNDEQRASMTLPMAKLSRLYEEADRLSDSGALIENPWRLMAEASAYYSLVKSQVMAHAAAMGVRVPEHVLRFDANAAALYEHLNALKDPSRGEVLWIIQWLHLLAQVA